MERANVKQTCKIILQVELFGKIEQLRVYEHLEAR